MQGFSISQPRYKNNGIRIAVAGQLVRRKKRAQKPKEASPKMGEASFGLVRIYDGALKNQWPQPQPPPQQPPPLMGGKGLKPGFSSPPLPTRAKTDIARLAGCSQLGQSAPWELMGCNLSNLWLQVGHRYSYSGIP